MDSENTPPVSTDRFARKKEAIIAAATGILNRRGVKGMTLADALSADPQVSARLDRATIDRLTSPGNYLGLAPEMVDRVLAASKR